MQDLIVFSHLRWNFVHQRPQHLMTRLARWWRVLFVEEPVQRDGEPGWERQTPCEGVVTLRPHTPLPAHGFDEAQMPLLREMLARMLERESVESPVAWFYTPMALPLLAGLRPRAIVYDCMDELSAFRHAPAGLKEREAELLGIADVVFTGGPSLHAAKRGRHRNVHCFPSAVDAGHFASGAAVPVDEAADRIAHPRLGYVGVIDERMDLALVEAVASARPDWQFVMAGPVAKIDPASLPRRPNLHWIGSQPYAALPSLLAGWDVALMPFALNESTRFISPTKTLEYLAAGRPVVSTPVEDVALLYGDAVAFAADAAGFVQAAADLLAETPAARERRLAIARRHVSAASWDRVAERMERLVAKAVAARRPASIAGVGGPAGVAERHTPAPGVREVDHLIVGAGPTGLAAAYYLGRQPESGHTVLIEREPTVGGWCRSVEHDGFTFDHAGHIMFSKDPEVLALYEKLLGANLHWQDREAWVRSKGVYTRYPFQGALYGLPPDVLKECLLGAIEARYGDHPRPRNFEEFIVRVWGEGIARHFALPYNEKLWAVPLDEMETSWLEGRVPLPDLEEIIDGALKPVPKPMGPNARFGYPLKGGFQALMDGFLPLIDCEMSLGTAVVAVSPSRRLVRTDDGRLRRYGTLVSTMPLPRLVQCCGDEAPAAVRDAAAQLRSVSVRCVNLGIARPAITEKHWIYYPEDTVFHRIFVQANASPHNSPPGAFGITCEITHAPTKPLPCDGAALVERCMADARRAGLLRDDDRLIAASQVEMPGAYVVYDHARARSVATIREWLAGHDIVLAGRYSEWEYYNSDHAFLAGRRAAETCLGKQPGGVSTAAAAA